MVKQIRELESYGRDGINLIAPLDQQYQLIEDFAYNVMSKKLVKETVRGNSCFISREIS